MVTVAAAAKAETEASRWFKFIMSARWRVASGDSDLGKMRKCPLSDQDHGGGDDDVGKRGRYYNSDTSRPVSNRDSRCNATSSQAGLR